MVQQDIHDWFISILNVGFYYKSLFFFSSFIYPILSWQRITQLHAKESKRIGLISSIHRRIRLSNHCLITNIMISTLIPYSPLLRMNRIRTMLAAEDTLSRLAKCISIHLINHKDTMTWSSFWVPLCLHRGPPLAQASLLSSKITIATITLMSCLIVVPCLCAWTRLLNLLICIVLLFPLLRQQLRPSFLLASWMH